jgi:hypothetical protein
MTEFKGAESEQARTMAITKLISHEAKWPLEYIGPSKL